MIIKDFSSLPDLYQHSRIALDIETCDPFLKSLGPGALRKDGYIVGLGIVPFDSNEEYYIHKILLDDKRRITDWFNKFNFDIIAGQNILYDLEWLSSYGFKFNTKYFLDSMFGESLINPNKKKDLDSLAERYLKDSKKSTELKDYIVKVLGISERDWKGNIHKVPKELVAPYCLKDAKLVIDILRAQKSWLISQGLFEVFIKECSLIPILLEMKLKGVKVNQHKIKSYYYLLSKEIKELNNNLNGLNVNSTNAVSFFLRNKGFNLSKTIKGNDSITNEWLDLNKDDLDVSNINRLRKLLKVCSTFIEPYMDLERIHAQFHPLKSEDGLRGTISGRFSSSNPNLQNIPSKEKEFKKEIRGFFEPEEESEWYSFDYSQIEYRLVVNYGLGLNGENLRNQYRQSPDTDFHKVVMDWTGLPRLEAKIANFSLVYGGWYPQLQSQLKCSSEEAERIYNLYHKTFPTIRRTFYYYKKKALNGDGEIRTIWNRRRTLSLEHHEERKAMNSFIQGSAADIMKDAMLSLYKKGIYEEIGYPLLTVHDELDFSIRKDLVSSEVINEIKETMENVGKNLGLTVPLIVDIEKGPSWGDLNEIN